MKNKIMAKALVVILILVLVLGLASYLLMFRKPNTTIAPTTNTTSENITGGPVDCANDANCLSNNFLSCQPAEFKMDFTSPGSKYTITVYGQEGDKCHYGFKVLNADGSLMAGVDCKVPLTSISADTFKHFFGQDTGSVKDAQEQLQSTYCTMLQS